MDNKYYLPTEMSRVLETYYPDNSIPDDQQYNLRLLLHKHVPASVIKKPEEKQDNTKAKQDNPKTVWLRNIASKYKADPELVLAARRRWQSYIDAMDASFISMPIDWRMVVGLGGNSVFETDMTLHPLYGLPIIPGSALKGLTRAWVETEQKGNTQVPEPGGKSISMVEKIIGNEREGETHYAGSVIFFDAILMSKNFKLTLDIMNPHYPKYYQEDKPPSNDQHPVPVPFLTVSSAEDSQATFLFAVAPRNPFDEEQKRYARKALQWLQQALAEYGIGSKTSSGYGYMAEKPLYKRPEGLPVFQVGQLVTGMLRDIKNRDDLQVRLPTFASQALQYRQRSSTGTSYKEFSMNDVLIALIDQEGIASSWQTGNQYICSFLYEYEHIRDNCTVLVCKPRETSTTPATSTNPRKNRNK